MSADSSKAERIKQLSKQAYAITQQCATEPAFANAYWDHHEPGIYVDVVDGTPLFSSMDKFDSGSGWPSFTKSIQATAVQFVEDRTGGMVRTEVRSLQAQSHLGHVFDDGRPDYKRFCINSASLRFVAARDLQKEGYPEYSHLFQHLIPQEKEDKQPSPIEIAVFAGGCFWGMQELIRNIKGVLDTKVGYTGGWLAHPSYDDIKTGKTGHAEAIRIAFDPEKISYAALLNHFFAMHDPTTPNRQGNDIGNQYRSALFYITPEQKSTAEETIRQWNARKRWKNPIVTELTQAGPFYLAEEEHQAYLEKNPGGYTCHYYRTL